MGREWDGGWCPEVSGCPEDTQLCAHPGQPDRQYQSTLAPGLTEQVAPNLLQQTAGVQLVCQASSAQQPACRRRIGKLVRQSTVWLV